MSDMPRTREEIEAKLLELREERDRLRQDMTYVLEQIEAVQTLCSHPETYFSNWCGRWPTHICRVCGKENVPEAKKKP